MIEFVTPSNPDNNFGRTPNQATSGYVLACRWSIRTHPRRQTWCEMLHKTNFDQVSTKEGSKPAVLYHLIRGTQICRPRSTSYIAVSVYHSKPRVIAEILGFTYKSKLFVAETEANGSLDCVSRKGARISRPIEQSSFLSTYERGTGTVYSCFLGPVSQRNPALPAFLGEAKGAREGEYFFTATINYRYSFR